MPTPLYVNVRRMRLRAYVRTIGILNAAEAAVWQGTSEAVARRDLQALAARGHLIEYEGRGCHSSQWQAKG